MIRQIEFSTACCILVSFLAIGGLATTCNQYDQKGIVYVIRSGNSNYYKIGGTTRTVAERMKELQTGNPMQLHRIYERVVPDCRRYETRAQDAAAAAAGTQHIILRSHTNNQPYWTEWFRVNNLNTFLAAVINVLNNMGM